MISKEMKSRIEAAEMLLADRYETFSLTGRKCFRLKDGRIISVDYMGPYNALVIEYAESLEDAEQNRFEDGDLFYLDEMDEKTMLSKMLQEIQQ